MRRSQELVVRAAQYHIIQDKEMNSSASQTRHVLFATAKVDKSIQIFTPNGLILKENKFIYLFPAINVPNIIHRLQI